MYRRN